MFLDELPKELHDIFVNRDFIAGWQNRPGKIEVMIIGTSPGMSGAAINRKPLFATKEGKMLWKMLKDTGWDKHTVYLTNIIKYPLRNNRDPTLAELKESKPILDFEIEKYNPTIIIVLGKYVNSMFDIKTYGQVNYMNTCIISINHPGYYLRKPSKIQEALDFLKLRHEMIQFNNGKI